MVILLLCGLYCRRAVHGSLSHPPFLLSPPFSNSPSPLPHHHHPYKRFALFIAPTCPASPSLPREPDAQSRTTTTLGAPHCPFPQPSSTDVQSCTVWVLESNQSFPCRLRLWGSAFSSLWDALYRSPRNSGNRRTCQVLRMEHGPRGRPVGLELPCDRRVS